MMCIMRTTISMDDQLAHQVRREAAAAGLSVSSFVARILDDVLKRPARPEARPFRLVTVGGKGVRPGIDLDRPRELEIRDDESRYG